MRFFPRLHTLESVATELIEGLENGTITLSPPQPSVSVEIAKALEIAAEVKAATARYAPEQPSPPLPTAEELAAVEECRPGAVREFLGTLNEARAVLAKLERARTNLFATVNDLAPNAR